MKPLTAEIDDPQMLEQLGRASVQVVHDVKNQLNGLKLYATFLKRRFDKFDRPEDEVETISKLIAGLERAAAEMNILVRLGRNIEIHPSGPTDLRQVLERVRNENAESLSIELPETAVQSRIDQQLFPEALSEIARWALGTIGDIGSRTITIKLSEVHSRNSPIALIELSGLTRSDETDPFASLAGNEGLRLSFAKKVIRAHGGEVTREGTSVFISLPPRADSSN